MTDILKTLLLHQAADSKNPFEKTINSDNYLKEVGGTTSFNPATVQGTFSEGLITCVLPGANCYRVTRLDFQSEIMCCDMTSSSYVFSTRPYQLHAVGSRVLIYVPKHGDYGFILGVIPSVTVDGRLNWSPLVSNSTGLKNVTESLPYFGIFDTDTLLAPFKAWISSKPLDTTALGDYGLTTATGGGFHLDLFMAYLRMSDTCGLWMFYLDQLTRLNSRNLELWSGAHANEYYNDEGMLTAYLGEAYYPWERLGFFIDPKKQIPLMGMDTNQPLFRYEEYGSYLGQGKIRQLSFPTIYDDSSNHMPTGVFKETINIDGSYMLQSAKSIRLSKRAVIKIPKRREASNSEIGFSPLKEVKDENPPTDFKELENRKESGQFKTSVETDLSAYEANWKALHTFAKYSVDNDGPERTDFIIPDAEDMAMDVLSRKPSLTHLKTQQYTGRPEYKEVDIHAELNALLYFLSRADIAILENGTILLRGAYGEEIKMCEGSIELSCPGDIRLMPGRALITMAGDDTIIKSNKSIDIVSNEQDVRIKAENNLDAVSGVSGRGRLLLENKGYGNPINDGIEGREGEDITTPGVIIKASDSAITQYASNIYLRSQAYGNIYLDADKGSGEIKLAGSNISLLASYYIGMELASDFSGGSLLNSLVVTPYAITAGSSVSIQGDVNTTANVVAGQNLFANNGHVYTSMAMLGGIWQYVQGRADDAKTLKAVQDSFIENMESSQTHVVNANVTNTETWNNYIWSEGSMGSDKYLSNLSYSYRNQAQYGTEEYVLIQPYWQQINDTEGLSTWNEKSFSYQDKKQAAYPGFEAWNEKESLYSVELTLYDVKEGNESEDLDDYREYEPADWVTEIPNDNYKIVVRE